MICPIHNSVVEDCLFLLQRELIKRRDACDVGGSLKSQRVDVDYDEFANHDIDNVAAVARNSVDVTFACEKFYNCGS